VKILSIYAQGSEEISFVHDRATRAGCLGALGGIEYVDILAGRGGGGRWFGVKVNIISKNGLGRCSALIKDIKLNGDYLY
jgi:hypothetical protein